MSSVAIVPAAGKSERFGGAKLLADVRGEPLLNHTIRSLIDGGVRRVVVVVPPGPALKVPLMADPRVVSAVNPDPARGMFSSIQAGASAGVADLLLVLPGDMPFVRPATVTALLEAAQETGLAISPRHQGRRGHPIALPGRLRAAILAAPADTTLSAVLAADGIARIEMDVDDPGILRDVDTPGDIKDIDH
jgi:molybdenum cofactor cytidylyltransferase